MLLNDHQRSVLLDLLQRGELEKILETGKIQVHGTTGWVTLSFHEVTLEFSASSYRVVPEPKYRPLTGRELTDHVGKQVVGTNDVYTIDSVLICARKPDSVCLKPVDSNYGCIQVSLETLFKEYRFSCNSIIGALDENQSDC